MLFSLVISSIFSLYIYIYIYLKEKTKTGHIRIINLFPSCYGFWYKIKNTKTNRTSSDLVNKTIQNRYKKEGWKGVEEG